MTTEEVRLVSGVYSDGTNTRTLLTVMNGRCVYGRGAPETKPWQVTSCSARSFIKSVGATPVRELTPGEAIRLAERMEPYSTKRRSNRWERAMFHCDKGRFAILVALEPDSAGRTAKRRAPAAGIEKSVLSPTRPGRAEWIRRLFRKIAGVLWFRRRNSASCSTVSMPAADRQPLSVTTSAAVAVKP